MLSSQERHPIILYNVFLIINKGGTDKRIRGRVISSSRQRIGKDIMCMMGCQKNIGVEMI